MSHSKRNTSLAFFTSHERSALRGTWGSQSARLNRDSFLPFGSCTLCLQPAVEPVGCGGGVVPTPAAADGMASNGEVQGQDAQGAGKKRRFDEYIRSMDPQGQGRKRESHVFCRECAIFSLLNQKKEMKRWERERELRFEEEAEQAMLREEEARVRQVEDFERVQGGLGSKYPGARVGKGETEETKDGKGERLRITANGEREGQGGGADGSGAQQEEEEEGQQNGQSSEGESRKRKFNFDDSDLLRVAESDQRKAHKALDAEDAAQARAKHLPSFWVPALTPSAKSESKPGGANGANEALRQPLCPASTPETAHLLTLKGVIPVRFTEEVSSTARGENSDGAGSTAMEGKTRICPSCSKPLTNASRAILAKPCGHVVCGNCVEQFVLNEDERTDERGIVGRVRCFVCGEDLTPKPVREGKKEKVGRGLIQITSEGTGFAGGGKNVVKKQGTAFQC